MTKDFYITRHVMVKDDDREINVFDFILKNEELRHCTLSVLNDKIMFDLKSNLSHGNLAENVIVRKTYWNAITLAVNDPEIATMIKMVYSE